MIANVELLYNMYEATCTDDGNGDIETYESWLERQLIERIRRIADGQAVLRKGHKLLTEFYITQDVSQDASNMLDTLLVRAVDVLGNINRD